MGNHGFLNLFQPLDVWGNVEVAYDQRNLELFFEQPLDF